MATRRGKTAKKTAAKKNARTAKTAAKKAAAKKMAAPPKKAAASPKKAARSTGKPRASAGAVNREALRKFVRTRAVEYLDDHNITSVGIGLKDGKECIQFTVAQKAQPEQLEALGTRRIPPAMEVDGELVPTDVVERTFTTSYEAVKLREKDRRKQRVDPLVPGISVSHPKGTAGTLGTIVYDVNTGAPCMLSNWHVLHGSRGRLGDVVVQPGPFDDNRVSRNEAGVLVRSHLGAAGDCAIARIEGREYDPTVFDLGVAVKELARPELGDLVVKSGRTTAVTTGIVRRVDVTAKIDYDGTPHQIGCFEIGPPDGADSEYEVSMGGDSGSVWLVGKKRGADVEATEIMVGLHFAGEGTGNADEHALACYAHSVFEKLEIGLEPPDVAPEAADLSRRGYDENFLGKRVAVPALPSKKKNDVVRFANGNLIPYTHFSVCLSKQRRFAHFVAWNVDGETLKAYGRKNLKFKLDPRIDEDAQIGEELYGGNKLDRGHIARRADLVWGPKKEAQQANADSFYFTNIAPQHEAFNQSRLSGLWGELENAIFEEADVEAVRLSVLAGPIFKRNDPRYRGVAIPRSFWKLIAFVDAEDKKLKAKAYVLTQDDLLSDLEAFELDPFRMYQVSIEELEGIAGLEFGALTRADTFEAEVGPEGVAPRRAVREIVRREDIVR